MNRGLLPQGARLEGREGCRGFASAVQHWPMWTLLRIARTGPRPHPAAGRPGAQFFPIARKGGINPKEVGRRPLMRGSKELDVEVKPWRDQ